MVGKENGPGQVGWTGKAFLKRWGLNRDEKCEKGVSRERIGGKRIQNSIINLRQERTQFLRTERCPLWRLMSQRKAQECEQIMQEFVSYAPFLYSLFFFFYQSAHPTNIHHLFTVSFSCHHCLPVYNTSLSLLQCVYLYSFLYLQFFFYSKSPDPFLQSLIRLCPSCWMKRVP